MEMHFPNSSTDYSAQRCLDAAMPDEPEGTKGFQRQMSLKEE